MVSMTRAPLVAVGTACPILSYPAIADQPNQTAQAPTSFWARDVLSGSWGGLKSTLSDDGITIGVTEQAVTSNVITGAPGRAMNLLAY